MTPITNISPLTFRDAGTFLEYLETIKQFLNETLVPDSNAMIDNAIKEFQTGIANAEATVNAAKEFNKGVVDTALAQVAASMASLETWVNGETAAARAYVDALGNVVNNKTGNVEVQETVLTDDSFVLEIDPLWPNNHPANIRLKQDATGGRAVELGANILGFLDLEYAPDAVTELTLFPNGDGTWNIHDNKWAKRNASVYSVKDYYPKGYKAGITDVKSAFDAAVAAAPEGAVIQFEAGKEHFLSAGATITKALDIDGNGSSLIVDPTPGAGTQGVPVFYFRGSLADNAHALTASNKGIVTVTLATPAEAANYAVGDRVIVSDSSVTRPWDYGGAGAVPTYPDGYVGQQEITTIKTVNAVTGAIKFLKPLEFNYTVNPVIRKITKMIQSPRVRNFKRIHEIDPGGLNNNPDYGPAAPHIIHGQYCHTPKAENISFDGWNKHCVNWFGSINPQITEIWGKNPYRPDDGGHGYLTRFDRTLGGSISHTYSELVRHHTDYVMAMDAYQHHNTAVSPVSAAYAGHGFASKRVHSDHDTVLESTAAWGWMVGNLAFNADYDFTISNFTYQGTSNAVVIHAKAENVSVIDPDIHTTTRAFIITTGAKNVRVSGGTVETVGNGATNNTFLIREKAGLADPYGIRPGNISIKNVHLRGTNPQVWIDSAGKVELADLLINEASSTAVGQSINLIQVATVPESFRAVNIGMSGIYGNGIYIPVAAPAGEYFIGNIDSRGHTERALTIPVSQNLKFIGNSAFNNGNGLDPWNITGDVTAAIKGANGYGAIIMNNSPRTRDELRVKAATVEGAVNVNGAAGSSRAVNFTTGDVLRWIMRANANAEAGGNVGTDFELISRDDAGALLTTVFNATRLGDVKLGANGRALGFFGGAGVTRPVITGSRAGETATTLAMRNALTALGLVTDATTA
jgi:hypothetical protein